MAVQADKVAAAFEQQHEVRIGTDVFSVRAFGMRQITNYVLNHLRTIVGVYELADKLKAEGVETSEMEKFQACGDAAYEILGVAIGKPLEYFDTANPMDTLKAFAVVVELNIPFFVKALENELPKTIERIEKAVSKLRKPAAKAA